MYKDDYQNKTGKYRFEGFLLDLLEHLSQRLHFEYDVYEVKDGNYGKKLEDGTWNGMIRDLMDGVSTTTDLIPVIRNVLCKTFRAKGKLYQILCACVQYT